MTRFEEEIRQRDLKCEEERMKIQEEKESLETAKTFFTSIRRQLRYLLQTDLEEEEEKDKEEKRKERKSYKAESPCELKSRKRRGKENLRRFSLSLLFDCREISISSFLNESRTLLVRRAN